MIVLSRDKGARKKPLKIWLKRVLENGRRKKKFKGPDMKTKNCNKLRDWKEISLHPLDSVDGESDQR